MKHLKKRVFCLLLAVALALSVSGADLGAFATDDLVTTHDLAVTIEAGETKNIALELTDVTDVEGGNVAAFQLYLNLPEGVTATKGVAQGFLTEMEFKDVKLQSNDKTDEVHVTGLNLTNVAVTEQNKRFAVITLTSEKGVTDAFLTVSNAKICQIIGDASNVYLVDTSGTITIVDSPSNEPPPEPGPVTYTVETVPKSYVPKDGTVDVDVFVDTKDLGLSMVDVVVVYDKETWELVGGVAGDVLKQFGTYDVNISPVEPTQSELGEAWITGMSTANFTNNSDDVLATLTFKAKTALTEKKEYPITIVRCNAECLEEDGTTQHPYTADEVVGVDGGISIVEPQAAPGVDPTSIKFDLGSFTSPETIPAGTEVTLKVTAPSIEKLGMLELLLGYDGNKLELVKAELGDGLNGFAQKDLVTDPANPAQDALKEIWISAMGENQAIKEGALIATLTFKTKVEIQVGKSVVVQLVSDPLAAYEEDGVIYSYALTKDNVVGGTISAGEGELTHPSTDPSQTTTTTNSTTITSKPTTTTEKPKTTAKSTTTAEKPTTPSTRPAAPAEGELGDVDGDGKFETQDADLIYRFICGQDGVTLDKKQRDRADWDRNYALNIEDALRIFLKIAGKIS